LCIVFSIIDYVFCIFYFLLGRKNFGCEDGIINNKEEKEERVNTLRVARGDAIANHYFVLMEKQ